MCWLLRAQLELARDSHQEALELIKLALGAASPEGYVRAFADELPGVAALIEEARDTCPGFVGAVMAAHRAEQIMRRGGSGQGGKGSAGTIHPSFQGDYVEPLSARELDVLRLVANGLSNAHIAEALFVSVGTVKKHLNNIFGKLNVTSRTQAVSRARELDLIL